MNIEAAYPSKYLKAADLQGKTVKVTIRTVVMEAVGQNSSDQKPILYFEGKDRGMVLNRTNATTISHFYGQDTDDWPGREIELFAMMVDFKGTPTEGLRVRIPRQARPAPVRAPEPPPHQELRDAIDDEIPF